MNIECFANVHCSLFNVHLSGLPDLSEVTRAKLQIPHPSAYCPRPLLLLNASMVRGRAAGAAYRRGILAVGNGVFGTERALRSEERRVGKECRSRLSSA